MNHRILAVAATIAAATALSSTTLAAAPGSLVASLLAPTSTAQEGAYFRTKTVAIVRNFPDRNGSAFAEIPAGTIVRAYSTSQGKPPFREVEIAGGFPVWVFGEYLQPTNVDEVLLVTGSRVNMRPSPGIAPSAMPLRSKLDAGQRVKLIERAKRAQAFGEDWIKVQAPATTRAWIVADAVTPIDAATGAAEWERANPALPTRSSRPSTTAGTAKSASSKAAPVVPLITAELLEQLAEADRLFDAASALRSPTAEAWRDVVIAYEAVVEQAPAGSITRQNAASRLQTATAHMELASLRETVNEQARENDEQLASVNAYIRQREVLESARWGRFQERGWVDERKVAGERRWFLIFGGQTVAEIQCTSSRYDLSVFDGFEIGVIGDEIQPGMRATAMSTARARIVDVAKIEVISGSSIER